jgi:hypothetical protein
VQYGDDREREAVRDRGEEDVPVGIQAGSDGGADDVDDARERSPDGGFPESLTFVSVQAWCPYLVGLYDLRGGFVLNAVYGFRFPFSSYS